MDTIPRAREWENFLICKWNRLLNLTFTKKFTKIPTRKINTETTRINRYLKLINLIIILFLHCLVRTLHHRVSAFPPISWPYKSQEDKLDLLWWPISELTFGVITVALCYVSYVGWAPRRNTSGVSLYDDHQDLCKLLLPRS